MTSCVGCKVFQESLTTSLRQEPDMQKVTGKTDPVDVMHALREMKNNFK